MADSSNSVPGKEDGLSSTEASTTDGTSTPTSSDSNDGHTVVPIRPDGSDDGTTVGTPISKSNARDSKTQTDNTAENTSTSSTRDSETQTDSAIEKKKEAKLAPAPQLFDDSWIEDWDSTIHRCGYCKRPFVTRERLAEHTQVWHSLFSPNLQPYQKIPASPVSGGGSKELVVVVEGGDLFIVVSKGFPFATKRVRFQVASSVLWTASRVFNSMFGPTSRFQEAIALRRSHISGFAPAVVTLPDDLAALEYVFNVLHHRQDALPKPTHALMVEVAAVCDKYELHRALQPVADRFFLPKGQKLSKFAGGENWLLISYVFGYDQIFAAVSKHIILDIRSVDTPFVIDSRTPQKVTATLARRRKSIMDKVVAHLHLVQAQRSISSAGQVAPPLACLRPNYQRECEALQLGDLTGTLHRHGLSKDEQVHAKSVHAISSEVAAFKTITLPSVASGYNRDHSACTWVPGVQLYVETLVATVVGLRLEDFPSSKRSHK